MRMEIIHPHPPTMSGYVDDSIPMGLCWGVNIHSPAICCARHLFLRTFSVPQILRGFATGQSSHVIPKKIGTSDIHVNPHQNSVKSCKIPMKIADPPGFQSREDWLTKPAENALRCCSSCYVMCRPCSSCS
jgi:hypothetical protein